MLHEFVAVASAFEDAGFDAAGAVGDFALGDLGEQREAVVRELLGRDATACQVGPAHFPQLLDGPSLVADAVAAVCV